MTNIKSDLVYNVVKKLVLDANISLPKSEYLSLKTLYEKENNLSAKLALKQILNNAKIASNEKRPLCQDTGFVTVFLDVGQDVSIVGENINSIINSAVSDAYKEFSLRKSIVSDVVFTRKNTLDNTPVLIHTTIVDGDEINITISIKGGGCENISVSKMLLPTQSIEDIKDFVIKTVKNAGSKPCPPIKVGIGIGSNFEGAAILSKKALIFENKNNTKYSKLESDILREINKLKIGAMGLGGKSTCFGVNILTSPCHIASLPVAISLSCHSSRHASAKIQGSNVIYDNENYEFIDITDDKNDIIKVTTNEIEKIKSLQTGSHIELSGKIYTARDAAHKKFDELIKNGEKLPFDIKNAIIFYAGPCPANNQEIIGPIGPTTSARMDKYTSILYKNGLLATIGKGQRSQDVMAFIRAYNGKYFSMTGGVASLIKKCIKSSKVVAYPELGAEAVHELVVENLPLRVEF